MFRVMRNKKFMRGVVIFVAIAFTGGFAGVFAFSGMPVPGRGGQSQENDMAQEIDQYVSMLEDEISYYEQQVQQEEEADYYMYLGELTFQLAQVRNMYYNENPEDLIHQAKDHYREALRLDPDQTTALLSLAIIQTAIGEYDSAEENYREFLEIHPDNFNGRASYAHMLLMDDQTQKAREQIEEAEQLASGEEQEQMMEQLYRMLEQENS